MPHVRWTREAVIAAIQAFVAHHGRWPTSPDCRQRNGLPQVVLICRLFGTIDAARQAAGMPPGALPKQGAAFKHAWAGTWRRDSD